MRRDPTCRPQPRGVRADRSGRAFGTYRVTGRASQRAGSAKLGDRGSELLRDAIGDAIRQRDKGWTIAFRLVLSCR
jgi:hypothetical protein